MEVKEALLKRRSCRKFTDQKVEDEKIHELLLAAMSGPSACNKKPWVFYVIKNEEVLNKLKSTGRATNFNSSLMFVVCGDTNKGITNKIEDYWIQDCSASVENILLMSTSLGLGTCWCGVFPIDERVQYVKEVLNLDSNIIPLGLIHVGYPDCEMESRTQYEEENVHII